MDDVTPPISGEEGEKRAKSRSDKVCLCMQTCPWSGHSGECLSAVRACAPEGRPLDH